MSDKLECRAERPVTTRDIQTVICATACKPTLSRTARSASTIEQMRSQDPALIDALPLVPLRLLPYSLKQSIKCHALAIHTISVVMSFAQLKTAKVHQQDWVETSASTPLSGILPDRLQPTYQTGNLIQKVTLNVLDQFSTQGIHFDSRQ